MEVGQQVEVSSQIPGQLSLDFGDQAVLNEAELAVAESLPKEPTIEGVLEIPKCNLKFK